MAGIAGQREFRCFSDSQAAGLTAKTQLTYIALILQMGCNWWRSSHARKRQWRIFRLQRPSTLTAAEQRALTTELEFHSPSGRSAPHGVKPRLTVSLFGGVNLRLLGRDVPLNNRKAKALVGYIMLTPDLRESRDRLIGMLWSESDAVKARASLRQVVRALHDTLDHEKFEGFFKDRSDVGFSPDTVECDVAATLQSAERGEPNSLLLDRSDLTETLLAGFEVVDPSFDAWLQVQREHLRQLLVRRLEARVAHADVSPENRKRVAEALAQIDPTHEIACQELMRSSADRGDTAGALATYNRLWKLLEDDYDMEPSEATQQLVVTIKSGRYESRPTTETTVARVPLVAVSSLGSIADPGLDSRASSTKMALVMGRFDAEDPQSQLAAGLRYDLISKLVRFREWLLIDAELSDGRLPPKLQPQYLITARLLRRSGGIDLILTLQERDTGLIVWSDRYSLGQETFAEAQQSIVQRIAATLNVHLSIDRLRRLASAPDVSLDVYDRWLRGQTLMQSYVPADRTRAAQIFRSIIEAEPAFAPAYSSLVQIENSHHIVFAGTYRTLERRHRATELARKAVSLDPIDSRSQLCLAWAHAMSDRHELAETYFHLARDLNADDPWTITSAALGLGCCNQLAEARKLADQALDRVPFPSPIHWGYQAQVRFLCHDFEGCLRAGEHAADAIRYLPAWLAAALVAIGRVAEATEEGRRFLELIRGNWHGEAKPTDAAIGRWFLQSFPIRNKATWEHLRSGLAAAGIPAPGTHPVG